MKSQDTKQVAQLKGTASFILAEAKRLGATDADVTIQVSETVNTEVRLGEVETLKGSSSCSVRLRCFIGTRSAVMVTTDVRKTGLKSFVRETLAMAKDAQEDPFAGLPEDAYLARNVSAVPGLYDEAVASMSTEDKIKMALALEKAALSVDSRVSAGRSAGFSSEVETTVYGNSRGLLEGQTETACSLGIQVVARDNQGMQTSGWHAVSRTLSGLDSPEKVGKEAAARTLRMLSPQSVDTREVPVVFDPQMAARLMSQFIGATSGSAIYLKRSFLVGKLGAQVAAPSITIIDDATIPGGLGSGSFNGEGLPMGKRVLIEGGKLMTYLTDSYSARKLKCAPTGGGISNLYLAPGSMSPEEIIATVKDGLYLTAVSGPGFNAVTGDYSMGATGIWIKDGKLDHAVDEITVAGNIQDMFQGIEAVGNDLEFRSQANAPTIKINKMMVAGKRKS